MQPSINMIPRPTRVHPPRIEPNPFSDGEKSSFLEDFDDFPVFFDDVFF